MYFVSLTIIKFRLSLAALEIHNSPILQSSMDIENQPTFNGECNPSLHEYLGLPKSMISLHSYLNFTYISNKKIILMLWNLILLPKTFIASPLPKVLTNSNKLLKITKHKISIIQFPMLCDSNVRALEGRIR